MIDLPCPNSLYKINHTPSFSHCPTIPSFSHYPTIPVLQPLTNRPLLQVTANVTTGPQPGSPSRPKDLSVTKTVSSVTLHWRNAHHGKAPVLGYYIEARQLGEWPGPDWEYSLLLRVV